MKQLTDAEFVRIRDYIKDNYGISLGNEKKSLVYSRLRSTLQELGLDNFSDYFDYLVKDKTGKATVKFIDKITTNHTFFMREPDHFDHFKEVALPYIESKSGEKDLRVWCAASSSGEEPYTLQMIIQDFFSNKPGWNLEILATDISSNVLKKAVDGIYDIESVSSLPPEWQKKYFKDYDDNYKIINDEVKKNVTYRIFNLMDEKFPFKKKFHVIFCRNVMIYFDSATRDALVERFYSLMEPGGYLYIGHSETLNHTNTKFKYVKPAVYRKLE